MRKRKNPHLVNFSYTGSSSVYFITICTADKQPYLVDGNIANLIQEDLEFRRTSAQIRLFCYCIMPDHVHMLLSLSAQYLKSLQNWVSSFKRYTSRIVKQEFDVEPLWQRNFYDHVVRKDESLLHIAEYVLNNPVRKGIVSGWEKYPYSRMVDPLPL